MATAGCVAPYRQGIAPPAAVFPNFSGDIVAGGILDRRVTTQGNAMVVGDSAEVIGAILEIPEAPNRLSVKALAILDLAPEQFQFHKAELQAISDVVGARYVVTGALGEEVVDIHKRWVIMIVIPVFVTFIVIPIPITYGHEEGAHRDSMTMRIVDLKEGRVISSGVEVTRAVPGKAKIGKGRVKGVLSVMGLDRKTLKNRE